MTFSCYGKSLANSLMTLAPGGRHTRNKTRLSLAQAKPYLTAAVVGQENDAQSEQHKQYNTQQRKTGVLGLKPDSLPRYIAVEGPIGVGKTSLTKRLASSLNYETFLEAPERNPFLERFYQNRKQAALQTQLFFLFERARQIQELRQGDMFEPVRVADFLLEKDRLFAEINLDSDEMVLYEKIYQHLTIDTPAPDLVIYLQAPVDVLLNRIQNRGIAAEQNIERSYLDQLVDAYTEFFHYYDQSSLLIVNAAEIDLVNNDQDYEHLLHFLKSVPRGRQYYNPTSSML